MKRTLAAAVVSFTLLGACGGSDDSAEATPEPAEASEDATSAPADPAPSEDLDEAPAPEESTDEVQMFPDVLDAELVRDGATWTISATLSSPYDTPERYADAWRVVGPDGTVYGERILNHDHASEQPFTRSESGITIPADVTEVTIEGRDLEFGYGGDTVTVTIPV